MFDRILYPTDFSDVSLKAVDYVNQLKDAGAKEVVVLHVVDERTLIVPDLFTGVDFVALENEMKRIANDECNKIVEQFQGIGLSAKSVVKKGIPVMAILETAQEEDVSLIVIGSHGKSNLKEMLLGSVSEAVIRKAVQPVLVIKR